MPSWTRIPHEHVQGSHMSGKSQENIFPHGHGKVREFRNWSGNIEFYIKSGKRPGILIDSFWQALSVPFLQHFRFYVQVVDTGHLVTASGNPLSLVICILDVSVVCVA